MVGQLAFLRIAVQSFHGNELTVCIALGHWLLWTGIGSLLGGRLFTAANPAKQLRVVIPVYLLALLGFAGLLFMVRQISGIGTSALVGNATIFRWTLMVFIWPCLLNGLFFPLMVAWSKTQTGLSAIHFTYIAEMFGAAIGSLLFALLLWSGLTTLFILGLAVWAMAVGSVWFWGSSRPIKIVLYLMLVLIAGLMYRFPKRLNALKWRPFRVVEFRESPYLSLTTVEYTDNQALYGDSQPLWVAGDVARAEELVHFALLNHSQPRKVLIIGPGYAELYREIYKYRSVQQISVLHADRVLQETLDRFSQPTDSLVEKHIADPYYYLLDNPDTFDVVLLNIPLPVNAQWNRYYSVEFFNLVRRRLVSDGVMALSFPGGEEYLVAEAVTFFKIIQNSVQRVFAQTTWIPGLTVHLLAADRVLHNDYKFFTDRLRHTGISNRYVSDHFLRDRVSVAKVAFLTEQIARESALEINTFLAPIGFYYDTILWDQQTGGWIKNIYQKLWQIPSICFLLTIFIAVILVLWWLRHRKNHRAVWPFYMLMVGFIVMAIETTSLILFQIYVGGLYLRMVMLMLCFMVGSGSGALLELKVKALRKLTVRHIFLTLLLLSIILCLPGYLPLSARSTAGMLYFLLFAAGVVAGVTLPFLARRIEESKPGATVPTAGKLYAWDIIGACAGVYLTSVFLIPVWGIPLVRLLILTVGTLLFFLTATEK